MALVIDLKPNEKVIIGDAVIRNDKQRSRIHIEGDTPILREKDILKEEEANSPCKKIYFLVQLMYLSKDPQELYSDYFELIREVQAAAPSMAQYLLNINEQIIAGQTYKALKEAKKLLDYEKELLSNVTLTVPGRSEPLRSEGEG